MAVTPAAFSLSAWPAKGRQGRRAGPGPASAARGAVGPAGLGEEPRPPGRKRPRRRSSPLQEALRRPPGGRAAQPRLPLASAFAGAPRKGSPARWLPPASQALWPPQPRHSGLPALPASLSSPAFCLPGLPGLPGLTPSRAPAQGRARRLRGPLLTRLLRTLFGKASLEFGAPSCGLAVPGGGRCRGWPRPRPRRSSVGSPSRPPPPLSVN